jgi:hypothetical protein
MVKRRKPSFKKLEALEARLPVTKPEAGKSKFVFSSFKLLLPSLDTSLDNERPENEDFKEV